MPINNERGRASREEEGRFYMGKGVKIFPPSGGEELLRKSGNRISSIIDTDQISSSFQCVRKAETT